MNDQDKYQLFIKFLALGPQPSHFGSDETNPGEYVRIYDRGLCSIIAQAFNKLEIDVQQDARNLANVLKRLGVFDDNIRIGPPMDSLRTDGHNSLPGQKTYHPPR